MSNELLNDDLLVAEGLPYEVTGSLNEAIYLSLKNLKKKNDLFQINLNGVFDIGTKIILNRKSLDQLPNLLSKQKAIGEPIEIKSSRIPKGQFDLILTFDELAIAGSKYKVEDIVVLEFNKELNAYLELRPYKIDHLNSTITVKISNSAVYLPCTPGIEIISPPLYKNGFNSKVSYNNESALQVWGRTDNKDAKVFILNDHSGWSQSGWFFFENVPLDKAITTITLKIVVDESIPHICRFDVYRNTPKKIITSPNFFFSGTPTISNDGTPYASTVTQDIVYFSLNEYPNIQKLIDFIDKRETQFNIPKVYWFDEERDEWLNQLFLPKHFIYNIIAHVTLNQLSRLGILVYLPNIDPSLPIDVQDLVRLESYLDSAQFPEDIDSHSPGGLKLLVNSFLENVEIFSASNVTISPLLPIIPNTENAISAAFIIATNPETHPKMEKLMQPWSGDDYQWDGGSVLSGSLIYCEGSRERELDYNLVADNILCASVVMHINPISTQPTVLAIDSTGQLKLFHRKSNMKWYMEEIPNTESTLDADFCFDQNGNISVVASFEGEQDDLNGKIYLITQKDSNWFQRPIFWKAGSNWGNWPKLVLDDLGGFYCGFAYYEVLEKTKYTPRVENILYVLVSFRNNRISTKMIDRCDVGSIKNEFIKPRVPFQEDDQRSNLLFNAEVPFNHFSPAIAINNHNTIWYAYTDGSLQIREIDLNLKDIQNIKVDVDRRTGFFPRITTRTTGAPIVTYKDLYGRNRIRVIKKDSDETITVSIPGFPLPIEVIPDSETSTVSIPGFPLPIEINPDSDFDPLMNTKPNHSKPDLNWYAHGQNHPLNLIDIPHKNIPQLFKGLGRWIQVISMANLGGREEDVYFDCEDYQKQFVRDGILKLLFNSTISIRLYPDERELELEFIIDLVRNPPIDTFYSITFRMSPNDNKANEGNSDDKKAKITDVTIKMHPFDKDLSPCGIDFDVWPKIFNSFGAELDLNLEDIISIDPSISLKFIELRNLRFTLQGTDRGYKNAQNGLKFSTQFNIFLEASKGGADITAYSSEPAELSFVFSPYVKTVFDSRLKSTTTIIDWYVRDISGHPGKIEEDVDSNKGIFGAIIGWILGLNFLEIVYAFIGTEETTSFGFERVAENEIEKITKRFPEEIKDSAKNLTDLLLKQIRSFTNTRLNEIPELDDFTDIERVKLKPDNYDLILYLRKKPEVAEQYQPDLYLESSVYYFDATAIGDMYEKDIRMVNFSPAPVLVTKPKIIGDSDFSIVENEPWPRIMNLAGESDYIRIRFKPTGDLGKRYSKLEIPFNNSHSISVELFGYAATPSHPIIEVVPEVFFDMHELGSEVKRSLLIRNSGNSILNTSFHIEFISGKEGNFTVLGENNLIVKPSSFEEIMIAYYPQNTESGVIDKARLIINSNDPTNPINTVELWGFSLVPEIKINSEIIKFGQVWPSTIANRTLQIINTGPLNVIISGNSFQIINSEDDKSISEHFLFFDLPQLIMDQEDYILAPGNILNLPIQFTPKSPGQHNALIHLSFGGNNLKERKINISGYSI